jgi:prophage antirepressor-like protein
MRSKRPEAEKFEEWVVGEVLPSIIKNGIYATEVTIDKMLNDPDFAIALLTNLKNEKKLRQEAESKNAILMHVNKTYTTTEIAKEIGADVVIFQKLDDLVNSVTQFNTNIEHFG